MSCPYGEIIFGWPWDENVEEYIQDLTDEEREEMGIASLDGEITSEDAQALGFETFYNCSDEQVYGYLGVKLDDVDVYEARRVTSFQVDPDGEQRKLAREKFDALPAELREILGEPSVWIVWGDT